MRILYRPWWELEDSVNRRHSYYNLCKKLAASSVPDALYTRQSFTNLAITVFSFAMVWWRSGNAILNLLRDASCPLLVDKNRDRSGKSLAANFPANFPAFFGAHSWLTSMSRLKLYFWLPKGEGFNSAAQRLTFAIIGTPLNEPAERVGGRVHY